MGMFASDPKGAEVLFPSLSFTLPQRELLLLFQGAAGAQVMQPNATLPERRSNGPG